MSRLLWLLSVALTAAILGTASAIYASQTIKPTGMIRIGPWEAVRAVGDSAADPYAHAYIASSGQLPPGTAEGLRFVATTSSDGRAIRPDCSVLLSGEVEIARLWTLSILAPDGLPTSDGSPLAVRRNTAPTVHSRDIVYRSDGGFDLTIGPSPRTPNTLLLRTQEPVSLVLHVYDGAISTAPDSGAAALPTISVGTDNPDC
ncbi:MAG: hypothetical protein AAF739_07580 [Pseudomonadota bacterium]